MTVNMDQLKERIERHCFTEWTVYTKTLDGPQVKDAYGNDVFQIEVPHPIWTCDDEADGCPEGNRNAVALAKLLVDLPGYALELIQTVERLQAIVRDQERDLEEAGRGF